MSMEPMNQSNDVANDDLDDGDMINTNTSMAMTQMAG